MSQRQMCRECPFRPGSKAFHMREAWADLAEKRAANVAFETDEEAGLHGCHMIEDTMPCKPENICVGHRDWENGIRHEKIETVTLNNEMARPPARC